MGLSVLPPCCAQAITDSQTLPPHPSPALGPACGQRCPERMPQSESLRAVLGQALRTLKLPVPASCWAQVCTGQDWAKLNSQ